jgi:hypothetical protein
MEPVGLDFVNKGPDPMLPASREASKHQADDHDTVELIQKRYRIIFGNAALPINGKQMQTVTPFLTDSDFPQVKQRISNFNNYLKKWIVQYNGLEKYNLPPKQDRKRKAEELLNDCNFIWSMLEVSMSAVLSPEFSI